MKKIVLAFTGKLASGKDTATEYFVKKYSAGHVKFSHSLRDTLDRLGLGQSREHMQELSRILRVQFGQDLLSKVVVKDVHNSPKPLVIVDGVRRPFDIQYLKEIPNFNLIAIEAPAELRFERMKKRGENTDDRTKTWEQFLKDEQAEADQLIPEIMKQADYTVDNSGSVEELHRRLEDIYQTIRDESQSKN